MVGATVSWGPHPTCTVTMDTQTRPAVEAALQHYVRSADMPCPYARLPTTYLYLSSGASSAEVRSGLGSALDAFWPDEGRSILTVIPFPQPEDHVEARRQAYWLRYHLHYLHLFRASGSDAAADVDERLRGQYLAWMSDAESFLGPRVAVGSADIMMTAFNPLYDNQHPRYAPLAVYPIIRSRDLLAVHKDKPELSMRIAVRAKCKMILSMLQNRRGLVLRELGLEYPRWLDALGFYRKFITTVYTDSRRIDPRTDAQLGKNRQIVKECMESGRFQASLTAFRIMICNNPRVPVLRRILVQNPAVSVFDIARVVYGDVAGLYVLT